MIQWTFILTTGTRLVSYKPLKSPIEEKQWSRYHKDCFRRDSDYMDWSGAKSKKVPGYSEYLNNYYSSSRQILYIIIRSQ